MNSSMEQEMKHLAELIKEIKIAMLTTVNDDGSMHTRPMATLNLDAKKFDGILWFFSKKNSQKNQSIKNEQHVNLAYSRPDKNHYISISGKAHISSDRQKMEELWNPSLKIWFPEGLLDPTLTLIGVTVESAEVWDSPITKASQLMSFVRSAITGKPYETSHQSHHIDM